MRLKPGVRVLGLKPELLIAIMVADSVFLPDELVLTSVTEGRHSSGSAHYTGMAFDARIRDVGESRAKQIARSIGKHLGGDYDVVLEETHLHVEFDPKSPY